MSNDKQAKTDSCQGRVDLAGQGAAIHQLSENSPRHSAQPLHQLARTRQRQGLSLRCVAKRLGTTSGEVRRQENAQCDLLLSELYLWQAALEVPLSELLGEPDDSLSRHVQDRAQMLRVMKTAQALLAQVKTKRQRRLAECLVNQLIELMPELRTVSAWPSVGQRRKSEEMGRIVENPVPENWILDAI